MRLDERKREWKNCWHSCLVLFYAWPWNSVTFNAIWSHLQSIFLFSSSPLTIFHRIYTFGFHNWKTAEKLKWIQIENTKNIECHREDMKTIFLLHNRIKCYLRKCSSSHFIENGRIREMRAGRVCSVHPLFIARMNFNRSMFVGFFSEAQMMEHPTSEGAAAEKK